MTEVPMIHTSRGNMALDDLEYRVEWSVDGGLDAPKSVTWAGIHTAKSDGEVVRREVHVCVLQPLVLDIQSQAMN